MDERQHPFRSLNSQLESFVRFINRTPHCITLYWIDYGGKPVDYGDLSPGESKEINTFVTHPWIFVNRETWDRYVLCSYHFLVDIYYQQQYATRNVHVNYHVWEITNNSAIAITRIKNSQTTLAKNLKGSSGENSYFNYPICTKN